MAAMKKNQINDINIIDDIHKSHGKTFVVLSLADWQRLNAVVAKHPKAHAEIKALDLKLTGYSPA